MCANGTAVLINFCRFKFKGVALASPRTIHFTSFYPFATLLFFREPWPRIIRDFPFLCTGNLNSKATHNQHSNSGSSPGMRQADFRSGNTAYSGSDLASDEAGWVGGWRRGWVGVFEIRPPKSNDPKGRDGVMLPCFYNGQKRVVESSREPPPRLRLSSMDGIRP